MSMLLCVLLKTTLTANTTTISASRCADYVKEGKDDDDDEYPCDFLLGFLEF